MTIRVPFLPFEVEFRWTGQRLGRVRVRDLMVVVALAAIGLHAWQTPERARRYRAEAFSDSQHARQAMFTVQATTATIKSRMTEADGLRIEAEAARAADPAKCADLSRRADELAGIASRLIQERSRLDARVKHYARLGTKYAWAADHAFWPLWPDPDAP